MEKIRRVINKIERSLESEEKILTCMQRDYNHLPSGNIFIKNKKGKSEFYLYEEGKERYISSNNKQLDFFIYKRVLEEKILASSIYCQEVQKSVEKMNERLKEQRIQRLSKILQRIYEIKGRDKYILSEEEYQWKYGEYIRNPYKPEYLKYITPGGVKIRSKSELIIGETLEKYGVLYRAEPEMIIAGEKYYPDFVIRKINGDIVIWEHMGLMDVNDYYMKACHKIENYRREGFVQHTNLICTYENDIQERHNLNMIIERFLLD